MTPSPDLLAVLREAREFVADYLDPDSDPGLVLAQRTLDRIDSALRAHEAQGWRPISEAPKDSTGIIGWFPVCRCSFDMVWNGERWSSFGGQGDFYGEQPTHFMPLPPPPETTT